MPSAEDIDRARGMSGWDKMVLDEARQGIIFTVEGLELDLGGIGKGYAVDRACDLLRERLVVAGIVNAGGDLRLWGQKPGGDPWVVGIQDPRRRDRVTSRLTITDRAVATSGDYERKFESGGRVYNHILDPDTGYPADGVRSVTVVAGTAEEADAYATGIFVMGPGDGRRFLEEHPDIEGIIVDAGGGSFVSRGLMDVHDLEE